MSEKVVNLFLFINDGLIREIGATWHDAKGSDDVKLLFLQSKVEDDWRGSRRHPVPGWCSAVRQDGVIEKSCVSYEGFRQLAGSGQQMKILEAVFSQYKFAPENPLMVVTPVVDGVVKIEAVIGAPD